MRQFLAKNIYGLGLCVVIAIAATIVSPFLHIGSVATAILIGLVVGNTLKPGEKFSGGIKFSEKIILAWAIALMGVKLDFGALKTLGFKSVLLIAAAMAVTISSSLLFAKIFKLKKSFALLLGIGNGICGSSAIAATKDIVGADEKEVGVSIAVVNFLGTVGIFLLPAIAKLCGMDELNCGIYIGNTLQAVGQVAAAGFGISALSGQTATIVKMGRILMLIPVCMTLIFTLKTASSNSSGQPETAAKPKRPRVPRFIIAFALLSLIPAFDLLGEKPIAVIASVSHYALLVAMAAIGMKITFSSVLRDGKAALLSGVGIFIIQIIFSGLAISLLKFS